MAATPRTLRPLALAAKLTDDQDEKVFKGPNVLDYLYRLLDPKFPGIRDLDDAGVIALVKQVKEGTAKPVGTPAASTPAPAEEGRRRRGRRGAEPEPVVETPKVPEKAPEPEVPADTPAERARARRRGRRGEEASETVTAATEVPPKVEAAKTDLEAMFAAVLNKLDGLATWTKGFEEKLGGIDEKVDGLSASIENMQKDIDKIYVGVESIYIDDIDEGDKDLVDLKERIDTASEG